ncbi:MAG TPA: stage II sporulation protein P [Firmicutes bacterium]|nr:stage II sporulation protein P [Candidatus Fermentithermobacillaceae bacterium]
MNISRRMLAWALVLVVATAMGVAHLYRSIKPASSETVMGHSERDRGYFTVVDETGKTVFTTGHLVSVGDEYIDEDDTKYVVISVSDDVATVRAVGRMEALPPFVPEPVLGAAASSGAVGIYHTHSAESYVPSDKTESMPGKGGVMEVGSALADQLGKLGVKAIHDKTPHDPNDARAYDRSRRTATALLKKQKPLALFDVHRDAGPAEPYIKEIDGKDVAKCMIVIGRQNPKMQSNLEFARRLKDEVNSKYPGLVKGIFMGNADFNQDLFDRALLLEMGTERTSKEAAMRGATLIGSVISNVLPATGPGARPQSRGAGRTIGWLLGVVVAGIFVYLWISTGSWEEMKAKLLGWFGTGGIRIGDVDGAGGGADSGAPGPDGESE